MSWFEAAPPAAADKSFARFGLVFLHNLSHREIYPLLLLLLPPPQQQQIDDNEGCDCFGCVLCGWQYGTGGCCLEDKDGHTWACILCEIQINCCTPCIVMVPLLVGLFHCSYFTCCCVKKTVAGAATTAGATVVSKQPQGTRIP